jgi:hypothetical protein
MKIYIYILIDPETQQVRYVGKTKTPSRRYSQHISECSKIKSYKNNWILSLKNKGIKPEMVVIDECNFDNWIFLEQWYIELFKSWNFNLTNLTIGGEGVCGHTRSKELIEKISSKLRGQKRSEEVCSKISKAVKGRKYSDEIKKRASIAAKKRGISKENRLKMNQAKKDSTWKHSEESKKIISEKLKIIANARKYKNNRPTVD